MVNQKQSNYATVLQWDEKRTRELSAMLTPYIHITDAYAELICEIVEILGTQKPSCTQDIVVRDLLGDVFDSLIEARRIILTAKCSTAYPVARRVYESLSLMVLCVLDQDVARKWNSGAKIENWEVREGLAEHVLGEKAADTKELYGFFSKGAHPNRCLIPQRFLGDGNEFTLGSVGAPSLALVTEYCMIHLRMWFWYAAVLLHYYQNHIDAARPDFGKHYLQVAKAAQKLQAELDSHYDRLLHQEQSAHAKPSRIQQSPTT